MTTSLKKSRKAKPVLLDAPATVGAVSAAVVRADVQGALPGSETGLDLYWEARVAAWLGVTRRRVAALRRRALAETRDWVVHEQQVVYTALGVQTLRDHFRALGVATTPDKAKEPDAAEVPAPVGPPEKAKGKVLRIYPANPQLMLASVPDRAEPVMVRVRDNRFFMPGMVIEIVHDVRSTLWQFSGRMPRSKGRW